MENSLETIDVLNLLPQRPPFIMIDKLVFSDEVVTTTKFLVRSDNIFMEGDVLNACALVENIAQTCAARMGYINYVNREKVRIGFIGSVRNLNILRPVRLGELLTTSIEVKEEVMQLTLVEASVRVGDETVVTAEMKIALSDIVAQG
ncbi:MAG: pseudouridylate synthase [Prevotella sp.]|nr:pseudouridylate synthase [Prevotella sp.]